MGERKRKDFKGKYDLFTIYLVPGSTIFLASLGNWRDTNLSVLGNQAGNQILFALWGFLAGIYYCIYMRYLFRLGCYRKTVGKWLVYMAAAFLLTAVLIPYLPGQYPVCAFLHVFLAFFSPVLLTAGMVLFLWDISRRDRLRFQRAWGLLWLLSAAALVFLLKAGFITSFLEVFVVAALCWYMRYVERLLNSRR